MEPQSKVIDILTLPFVGSVPSVYANNADTSVGPWDIRIIFSEIVNTGNDNFKDLRANVVMHPAHAKALAMAMTVAVQSYEEAYGAIRFPGSASEKPQES